MDQETLKTRLHYDPETGEFRWIKASPRVLNRTPGRIHKYGYRTITIGYKEHKAHRLAWIYMYGAIPDKFHIDHINGDRSDNRISNLRLCTVGQNSENQRKPHSNNKCGHLGVYYMKQKSKYAARIQTKDRRIHIGLFDTADEAGVAYLEAKRRLHEFCTI